jgi:hypothetical protein
MVKATLEMLLAMATLAVLSSTVSGEVISDSERLPAIVQLESASEGELPELLQSPAETATNNAPTTDDDSDVSAFVDDWSGGLAGDSVDPNCSSCCLEEGCCGTCCEADSCDSSGRRITADVELMALRTHFGEDALGKLAEKYELSERITLGMENSQGIGGRVRYWTYDRSTPNLQGGSRLRADFDVIDFEGTTRFGTSWFDITLAGGVRWADIKLDVDSGRCRNDMPGGSFGLDVRGLLCRDCDRNLVWRSISGARWSIFGGDWECSNGLIPFTRDDNLTVTEIYGGVECTKCCRGREVYARLVLEAQNWRSDALGEATDVDSISFIGPGVNLGVNF